MFTVGDLPDHIEIFVPLDLSVGKIAVAEVSGIDYRLVCKQCDAFKKLRFLGSAVYGTCSLALVESLLYTLEEIQISLIFLVALDKLLGLFDPSVDHFYIREDKLNIDRINIALGVDTAVNMDDIIVFKAAHNVNDSVHLADIRKEFISETLAL